MENGKGDSPRPRQVSDEVWEENWDKVFNTNTYEEWLQEQLYDSKTQTRTNEESQEMKIKYQKSPFMTGQEEREATFSAGGVMYTVDITYNDSYTESVYINIFNHNGNNLYDLMDNLEEDDDVLYYNVSKQFGDRQMYLDPKYIESDDCYNKCRMYGDNNES